MTDESASGQRPITCELRNGSFVEPCFGMQEIIAGPANSIRKGVGRVQTINMTTRTISSSYLIIKTDNHKNGLVMNFCPFCGTDIIPQNVRDQMSADQ